MQTKSTMGYHIIPVRKAITKKSTESKCWRVCGEMRMPLHCWWECELAQPLWRTVCSSLKTLKQSYHMTQQSHSWAFVWRKPLLQKDTRTPTFSAALFTKAKARNNLNAHWQRHGTYKQRDIHHKKEWNNDTCSNSNMDWPNDDCVSQVGQAEKGKCRMLSLIRVNFKKRCEWTYLHIRNRFTDLENELIVISGECGGEGWAVCLGVWD